MEVFLSKSRVGYDYIIPYTQGLCHVFAVAMHRRFGTKLFVTYSKSALPTPNVYHVYAMDASDVLWDITGRIDKKNYRKHIHSVFNENQHFLMLLNAEEYSSEQELEWLVRQVPFGALDPENRPLVNYTDRDISHADDAIDAAFGGSPELKYMSEFLSFRVDS